MSRPKEPPKFCTVAGCLSLHLAKGFCAKHYQKYRIHGDPLGGYTKMTPGSPCLTDGCSKLSTRIGLCDSCYLRNRRTNRLTTHRGYCSIEGCSQPHASKGLCEDHYYRMRRYGDPLHPVSCRKGTGSITKEGYRTITCKGRVFFEHRRVMEDFIGRPLLKTENVHHRNGDRLDNRITNLELWSKSQPAGQRISDKISWAREILSLYETLEGTCVTKLSTE